MKRQHARIIEKSGMLPLLFVSLSKDERTPQNVLLFQSFVIVLGNAGKLDGVGVVICCDC